MENLKPFIGSLKDAYNAAKTDDDQFLIVAIIDYLGDPEKRTYMQFLVQFEDGRVWVDYNLDLSSSTPFQLYCSSNPELEPLTMSANQWKLQKSQYNRDGIIGVQPGDLCYVDLKAWGDGYFRSLNLPVGRKYVVECSYIKWTNTKRNKIDVICPLFHNQVFEWNATAVRLYGMSAMLLPAMMLVDESFCREFPGVLG